MTRRKQLKDGKEVALTIEMYSDGKTKFPEAWDVLMQDLQTITKGRVIGFRCKVWLGDEAQ